MYYKKKFQIIKSTYNSCFFNIFCLLKIIKIQTINILILAYYNFANKNENIVQNVKIMIKNWK